MSFHFDSISRCINESKGFMKFIIFHNARIFYETHDASLFWYAVLVFSWINENFVFLKIVTRGLSVLAVKRINFSFQSIVKKRESWDSLDSPLCFSDRLSKKKISDNSWKKKQNSCARDVYVSYRHSFFGHIANCFFSLSTYINVYGYV